MNNPLQFIQRQVRLGWLLLAGGVLLSIAGILLPLLAGNLPFNHRIVTGLGILLGGIGLANLVRYAALRGDSQAAQRVVSAEHDERMQSIRARSGNRAFWVSIAMTYAILMWLSFAENGSLPKLSGDMLWICLAAAVILPFVVYVASLAVEQNRN